MLGSSEIRLCFREYEACSVCEHAQPAFLEREQEMEGARAWG